MEPFTSGGVRYFVLPNYKPLNVPAAPVPCDTGRVSVVGLVRDALKDGPSTQRELADRLQCQLARVNGAIWRLIRRGEVAVVGYRPTPTHRPWGRMSERVYGLTAASPAVQRPPGDHELTQP